MRKLIEKIIGSYSNREVKKITWMVDEIEALEPKMQELTEAELKAKTVEFKERLANGETLDDILIEAFAVVREASRRVLGMRHFRVQLIGGIILHQGRIAEMKTGEGKTLVATLPVYLNAVSGKGVHVVTVNDYLAKRDSEWMGKIYNFLGLSVGLIVHGIDADERREAYNCDITYGTNNEYGFDYLRDNMAIFKEEMVQRELNYAIVDEVDSILVDEARTPLIISGVAEKSTDMYKKADAFAKRLKVKVIVESDDKNIEEDEDCDYIVDEKAHSAALTQRGVKRTEEFFGIDSLMDIENMTILHHVNQALKAHGIMKKDKDYVVKDGEVIIVDEFTGRLMFGRRYSDGLHQAIEAKENVKVERESKTLATITFQNYFRMYTKLAGMTGTAKTEEDEFRTIYKLDVIEIPTNMPMLRKDQADVVYRNENGKFRAVVNEILESNKLGQPVLVGTISIEKSEMLSNMLKKKGIKHEVLNAKYHEKEAEIIAQAGKYGVVTIATNMAGRGTDIVLGGNPEYLAKQEMRKNGIDEWLIVESTGFNDTTDERIIESRKAFRELYEKYKKQTEEERKKVLEAGGLKILGTERHESRRIDNQLRGRSGRQGDPGESRFFISLEDDLMRLFGSERVIGIVEKLGMDEDMPIENKMLSNAIESAQRRVEGRNFGIRKQVLQYDDVMNKQREIIYKQRRSVLDGIDLIEPILKMREGIVEDLMATYVGESDLPDNWDLFNLKERINAIFGGLVDLDLSLEKVQDFRKIDLKEMILEATKKAYEAKEMEVGSEKMREIERVVMLRCVDQKWMDHIDNMDQLKHGIHLRAHAQKDPVVEYRFEGFGMFEDMIKGIQEDSITMLMHVKLDKELHREQVAKPVEASMPGVGATVVRKKEKVGRNDPCICGSGKKYKKCCGQ
ncbi:MAG: preprotein translocase subunit SecA [Deltaproteobacteria bacterium]